MTTTKKLAIAVVSLSLALVCVIGGTLAYLVAQSDVVTNTFTYGNIEITLTETEGDVVSEGVHEFKDVIPGAAVPKDPTVTVVKGSEKCYVYVLIDNQLDTAAKYDIGSTWTKIGESGTKVLYRYNVGDGIVDAKDAAEVLPVFTTLTFEGSLNKAALEGLKDKKVVISAYAHQAENTTQVVANGAAITWAGVTASE